jgi:hypothetical protein
MLFESDRSPLGRGQSYPIKAQALDALFQELGVDLVHRVKWLRRSESLGPHVVMRAEYDGLEKRHAATHLNRPGSVTLSVYSVPSEERAASEEVLLGQGLSRLASWLVGIADRPETWRTEPHDLILAVAEGKVRTIEESPRPPWERQPTEI